MATAKSNKKIPNTTQAGKAKSKPDKAARAAPARTAASKTAATKNGAAKHDGKKGGTTKTGAKKSSAKMTTGKKSTGKNTALNKSAGNKITGIKTGAVKTSAKKTPPKKPSAKKSAKTGAKTTTLAIQLEHIDGRTVTKIIAKLEEMREESQHIVNTHMQTDLMPREESLDVGDDLDQASNERDREFNMIMHQRHLRRLHQIEEAFNRMNDGSYGLCEGTDEPINPKRLLIMPLTKFSIEYQEMQEKMLGRDSLDGNFPESDESFGIDD